MILMPSGVTVALDLNTPENALSYPDTSFWPRKGREQVGGGCWGMGSRLGSIQQVAFKSCSMQVKKELWPAR